MKFAKELEEELVPEWRAKYLDYKQGKKKVKAIARALRNVEGGPRTPGRRRTSNVLADTSNSLSNPTPSSFTYYRFPNNRQRNNGDHSDSSRPTARRQSSTMFMTTPPLPIPEREPLQNNGNRRELGSRRSYGSIIATPPERDLPSLELPDPAMSPELAFITKRNGGSSVRAGADSGPYHVGDTKSPRKSNSTVSRRMFQPSRASSQPGPGISPRPNLLRRMFSTAGVETSPGTGDVKLHAYRELDAKQDDFFDFLDSELRKIEEFYKMKENEASERLQLLRGQLHEMRDRRLAELSVPRNGGYSTKKSSIVPDKEERNGILSRAVLSKSLEETFSKRRIGKTSAAMSKLASPPKPAPQDPESQRDYTRRPQQDGVQYRVAKRKLKLAMQEFYRGLELLKSYALLNRTAFRKMNKKYDKAVNARPTQRYMSEKVNKSWFVQSEVIEGYIVAVEDLYARYFERGNRKIAVGKLRSKTARTGAYTANTFRNGLLLAAGLVLGIEGLVNATHDVFSTNPVLVTQASYLLQIYGGYFLALFLFLLFVLDCRVWSKAKINYVFIFEYDTRHVLDWRQLGELPCLFFFFLGLFLYLNFHQYGLESMYIWWPVVLIALTMAIMLYPARVLYHHSRQWWAYSNWRLLLAGLYPVEFRDFFLGDMFCSQTYAMGNIELFFCLYANDWGNPPQCNSSHSRLLGFFSTLPAVWRALQCLRRYYDSRNWFPHLVNCGKYGFNILFYMSLSLYRVHRAQELRIVFILFATINAIYCSIWDLAMDWSLLNPYARYPLLRNTLGYRRVWIYYAAMVLDPVLRFNWIFYAIFTNELQHSAFLSFFVAFSEILRRGMWTLFRVENEHCTNVGRFRASRDIPLPYSLPVSSKTSAQPSPRITEQQEETAPTETTGADIERVASVHGGSLRMRKSRTLQHVAETPTLRGLQRVGTIITQAHAQDFEKKRRPGVTGDTPSSRGLMARGGESSEEEDEDDEEDNDGGTDAVETDENSSDLDVDEAEEAVDRPQSPRAGSSSVTQ